MEEEEPCVFCAIAEANHTPKEPQVFFADPKVLAFLDIQPLVASKAHVLVVPRKHYATLDELAEDPETSKALGLWLPRIAKAVMKASNATAFNIVQNNGVRAGQVVPHVHFHIVARDGDDPQSKAVERIVGKLREVLGIRDRVQYSAQVFGKGQRGSLANENLATKLRSML